MCAHVNYQKRLQKDLEKQSRSFSISNRTALPTSSTSKSRDVWLRDISLLFWTAVPYVSLVGFEFLILLPLYLKCCDYRLLPLQLWIFFKCSIWGSLLSYSNARQFSFFLPTSFKCWCSVSDLAWSNLSCHSHQQNESSYVDFFLAFWYYKLPLVELLVLSWFPPPCSAFIYLYEIIYMSMRTTDSDCATDIHTKSSCFISVPTGIDEHGIAIVCTVS